MLVIVIIILILLCFFTFLWGMDKSDEAEFYKHQVELLEEHKRLYLEPKYRYKDINENKSLYIEIGRIITIIKRRLRALH